MTCNVGGAERGLRVTLGIVLAILAWVVVATVLKVVLGLLAVVMLVTALTRYCPLNSLVGRNSCGPAPHPPR